MFRMMNDDRFCVDWHGAKLLNWLICKVELKNKGLFSCTFTVSVC